jgi:hypothetical protein
MTDSRPRRARGDLFAPCLLICSILLSCAATAGAAPARHARPTARVHSSKASALKARALPRPLITAARLSRQADRALISDAKRLNRCLRANHGHPKPCDAARHALQRAGSRLAKAELRLARIARASGKGGVPAGAKSASTWQDPRLAPQLTVSGQTLEWTRVDGINAYVLMRKVPGQANQYSVVTGTSTTPPPVPGATVHYSVRTAAWWSAWSAEQAITYPSASEPGIATDRQAAPTITVSGQTLTWNAVAGVNTYVFVRKVPGQADQYSEVSGTSITPPATPGTTVRYSVRTAVVESAWASEVAISYPAAAPSPSPTPSPTFPHKIIGTNDGGGWGPNSAKVIVGGGITWDRIEIGGGAGTVSSDLALGFHDLAIVGNTDDNTLLSATTPSAWGQLVVSQFQQNPGISIAEAGNEMYIKGSACEPQQYGKMYLAAYKDMQAAGIHIPLLFNMVGNAYGCVDGTSSGWLQAAVSANPGLAQAILANGVSTHPYGAFGENKNDTNGTAAVAAQESVAQTVLGAIPPVYITEFGYDLGRCGQVEGACSQQEQASEFKAAYEVFLADPHVAGIWCYQSHDDPGGQWGYMNHDNTTRPAFNVLSSFAIAEGQ